MKRVTQIGETVNRIYRYIGSTISAFPPAGSRGLRGFELYGKIKTFAEIARGGKGDALLRGDYSLLHARVFRPSENNTSIL